MYFAVIHFPLHEADRLGQTPKHISGPEGVQGGVGMWGQTQCKVVEKFLETLAGRMKGHVLATGVTWMLNLKNSCRGEVQALLTLWGKHMEQVGQEVGYGPARP